MLPEKGSEITHEKFIAPTSMLDIYPREYNVNFAWVNIFSWETVTLSPARKENMCRYGIPLRWWPFPGRVGRAGA